MIGTEEQVSGPGGMERVGLKEREREMWEREKGRDRERGKEIDRERDI